MTDVAAITLPLDACGYRWTSAKAFDPAADFDGFLKSVPARWVVYLMTDGDDRPVQLLCVRNLRYSLKRRLGDPDPQAGPSKRVDYRALVRRVYWRRVDSAVEADLTYLDAARAVFPESYQGMVGYRSPWFVHVNPETAFPRYTRTNDPSIATGRVFGPCADKQAAGRMIEVVESAFELCRYYNILVEAPAGRACAYKEMGRCPAPCDGTISMEMYRRMIELSAEVLSDPDDYIRMQESRMRSAAADLRYEAAAKIKAYIDELSELTRRGLKHARELEDFAYVTLQTGPRPGTAKLLLLVMGEVVEVAGLIDRPAGSDLLRHLLETADRLGDLPRPDVAATERIAVVAQHLYSPRRSGAWEPLAELDDATLPRLYREVVRQTPEETEAAEDEGVTRELGLPA